jgi:hypothetical protein
MRSRIGIRLLSLTLLFGFRLFPAATSPTKSRTDGNEVIKHAGEFGSPNGKCRATLTTSSMGGFLILTVDGDPSQQTKDVTGMAWTSDGVLVYTTSPIYGNPGVFVYSCGLRQTKRIVPPRTLTKAYPDGADYFQLKSISTVQPAIIYFYYGPDVDALDMKSFESPAFLYKVRIDGTGLGKA